MDLDISKMQLNKVEIPFIIPLYGYVNMDEDENIKYAFAVRGLNEYNAINIDSIIDKLEKINDESITIVVPESSNNFIFNIVSRLRLPVIVLEKNNPNYILEFIENSNLKKNELNSQRTRLNNMKNFKIRNIKFNQRHRYINCIFKPIIINTPVILFDDTSLSGTTLLGMIKSITSPNILKAYTIFYSKPGIVNTYNKNYS